MLRRYLLLYYGSLCVCIPQRAFCIWGVFARGFWLLQYGSLDLSAMQIHPSNKSQCALKSILYSADQSLVLYLLLLQCIPQVQYSAVCRSFLSVVFAVWPHISLIGSVLGDPFPSSSTLTQHSAMSWVADSAVLSALCDAVQCLWGLGGFSRGGDTRALLPVHCSELQCTIASALKCTTVHWWWHTCAIRGEQQLSALHYQRPDIEATILILADITSSSNKLASLLNISRFWAENKRKKEMEDSLKNLHCRISELQEKLTM